MARGKEDGESVSQTARLSEDHEAGRSAELARAQALIFEGAAQLDQGETLTAEEFFGEWDEELAGLKPSARQAEGLRNTKWR